MHHATAWAHPNVALIKYWGKRDAKLNLPATGSISLTLNNLITRSYVRFNDFEQDQVNLNGQLADATTTAKVIRVLDVLRQMAGVNLRAIVESRNDFPTGAGLASSASGFAALVAAAAHALKINIKLETLSGIARLGSGSAARSIFGGFVEMHKGELNDGSDAIAKPLCDAEKWPIAVIVAITSNEAKKVQSTSGMEHTRNTSPFWDSWVVSTEQNIKQMREAVLAQDFNQVGELAEHSCLKMHALAMSAQPGLLYWNSTTLALISTICKLRQKGLAVYFTIDAGPQVKVLCQEDSKAIIKKVLKEVPGVIKLIDSGPGGAVTAKGGCCD
ncbi:MAG: diphosphomevalonate decarboxylase [Deltaproteobacteria bacterium]|nr:diphosphomevalonate decarboxylase [Deltaproteobacteria bacterium]